MKIEELDLSVRSYNALKRAGIETVEQLRRKTTLDLYKIRNLGETSIAEIRSKLAYTPSNADRIRSMTDEELAAYLTIDVSTRYCKRAKECSDMLDTDGDIPEEWCRMCALEWLQRPADPIPPDSMTGKEE